MRPAIRLRLPPVSRHRAQRGVSLLFALMALVILGFGAVALTRSVDTSTLIMGNLSFRNDAVTSSSIATEQAIAWLQDKVSNKAEDLDADQKTSGYFASSLDKLDVTGNRTSKTNKLPVVDWDGNCNGLASDSYEKCDILPFQGEKINGNGVKWVITRLCDSTGVTGGSNMCLRPALGGTGEQPDKGELQAGGRFKDGLASPYFRIVVRVQGPRNTVSYTESLVHF